MIKRDARLIRHTVVKIDGQLRIDRLTRSIRNTNNRLIYPIVVVRTCDLPEDHEVIVKFRQQGVDVAKLEAPPAMFHRRSRR